MSAVDLGWIAGLVEGEGCFSVTTSGKYRYPSFQLAMVDEDVVARVADTINALVPVDVGKRSGAPERPVRVSRRRQYGLGAKPLFVVRAQGRRALAIADLLYPMLGRRRRAKIDELRELS